MQRIDIPLAALLPVLVLMLAFVAYCLVDLARHEVQYLPKWGWYFLVILPVAGPLLWLFFGAPKQQRPPSSRSQRGGAVGPDDDPDFLRGL